jgi:hypothetical protein
MLHRHVKVTDVLPKFSLIDQALIRCKHEFDRILDREDVLIHILVDPVEHRADRRTLTRPRHTSQQHHPLVILAEVFHERWQAKLLKRRNRPFDLSSDHADFSKLRHQVDTKTPRFALVLHNFRIIGAAIIMKDVKISLIEHRKAQLDHPLFSDRRHLKTCQCPSDSENGGAAHLQMNVRAIVIDRRSEDFVDLQFFSSFERRLLPLVDLDHIVLPFFRDSTADIS